MATSQLHLDYKNVILDIGRVFTMSLKKTSILCSYFILICCTKENDLFYHALARKATAGLGRHSVVKDSAVKVVLH